MLCIVHTLSYIYIYTHTHSDPHSSSSSSSSSTRNTNQQHKVASKSMTMAPPASASPSSYWVRGRVIGRGSFGSVFLGFHKGTGRVFAVKSVHLSSHPHQIDCLENEIQILSSLDHSPYVVGYLGNDSDASHRNLHLELLPGGTVTDAAGRKFSDEGTLRSRTRCLVCALRHVHSRGIVHCDVKGRNVIVAEDPRAAKLADFGSAIRVGSRSTPRGSPLWMAPEVVRGEYQGPESDVWSVGCTVIEMVTGRPAWEDVGPETLSRIGFSDELPEFPAELSAQGRDFIEKCLRRDPRERWSCDQLLRHPFLASEPAVDSWIDSSPRCVLDWISSDSEEEREFEVSCTREEMERRARGRVRELCHGGGAEWESQEDGWVAVRESGGCGEFADCERRASSEYCGTSGAERENKIRSPEYLNWWESSERRRRSCQHGTGAEARGEEGAVGIYFYGGLSDDYLPLLFLLHCLLLLAAWMRHGYCLGNNNNNNSNKEDMDVEYFGQFIVQLLRSTMCRCGFLFIMVGFYCNLEELEMNGRGLCHSQLTDNPMRF